MVALTLIVFPVFTAGFVAGKTPRTQVPVDPQKAQAEEAGRFEPHLGQGSRAGGPGVKEARISVTTRGLYRGHTAAHWAARYRHRTRQLMAVRGQVRQLKQQLRRRHTSAARPASSNTAYGVWDRLADCESSGDWAANTGNGFFGGLQFTLSTWSSHGGSGMPNLSGREAQIAVAERVLADQGWGAWPACSAELGLR